LLGRRDNPLVRGPVPDRACCREAQACPGTVNELLPGRCRWHTRIRAKTAGIARQAVVFRDVFCHKPGLPPPG
jgi:hypothetical protein